ncbi:glycosyltransferase family 1 protein [Sediminibacterium sp.]|uniref:glycosyltransferase family 4 protein n=1 Tax=Sediminibacterium sp. TaxID=1917865 RepID=UPI002736BA5D|nr:glycosyltransferase family 1 protein [Sediminibacterium sp.]MDP3393590.1 glycosyltransferase family 1 protein [Sediminibacterium sp.]MDP3566638.1 glycosyltransferase family 1 protein [Sediminibacterium sp.]
MTIRYDYQIFCEQPYGGISRYYYELIYRLQQKPGIHIQLDILSADNIFLEQLKGKNFWNELQFKGKKDLNRLLSNAYDSFAARMQPFDVFHPTYYSKTSLNRTAGKPMVITIHDMIDERFHKGQVAYENIIALRAKHISQADKIIAVSENTRNDLIELCGVDPNKIETIYHGNSFNLNIDRFTQPKLIEQPYLLYTGKRYAYKNFDRFLQSLIPIMKANPDLWLVCAGGGAFKKAELNQLNKLQLNHRVIYQPIHNNEQLASLYNHAQCLVYPSLYEGFGLPIIEAFACGCPVITSMGSSTGEIAGDAAVLINPNNTDEMTQKMNELLYNESLQNQLVQLGHNRAHLFNWDKTANQTLKLYQAI